MAPEAKRRGFSVRVFLPDGDPDGIKVMEKSNWTGAGLVVPRVLFSAGKARPELNRAGVYVLIGPVDSSPLPQVYVGEGDPIGPRLEQHARSQDFWTHAVAELTDEAASEAAWRIFFERDATPDRVLSRLQARGLRALP